VLVRRLARTRSSDGLSLSNVKLRVFDKLEDTTCASSWTPASRDGQLRRPAYFGGYV